MGNARQVELLLHELLKKRGISTVLNDQISGPAIRQLAEDFLAIREFTHAISNGDLSQRLDVKGDWAGSLKTLQSNLRHLAWQIRMVASGDFNQRIDFMSDLSVAFNRIIQRLKQAEENEKKYITELKDYENEIMKSEQKYRLIAENTDDVILLMDDGMNIVSISPSIEKLLGYTPDEFIELSLVERTLVPIETALRNIAANADESVAHPPVFIEQEQRRKDGQIIWLESSINIAKNDEGECWRFLCVIRNITERKLAESRLQQSYERRQKNDFFKNLLNGQQERDSEIFAKALRIGIKLPSQFSLYFLSVGDSDSVLVEANVLQQKQKIIDTIIDQLNMQDDTIAWEVPEGVGIISDIHELSDRNNREFDSAKFYISLALTAFPDIQVRVGIADYFDSLTHFALRFKHAKSSIRIGGGIWPDQSIYHSEDCGVYQVLIPFADTDEAEAFVQRMLGPLIEYDKNNRTELVETLEKILTGVSLKEVAAQMFFHYKTIQNRKQRIEKILNVTLDSSEVRLMLGTAVHLLKISQFKMI